MYREKKTEVSADDLENRNVRPLINEINTILQEAVKKGISYEIPESLTRHLTENVYVFSGGKTLAELRELSDLLKDENGGVKPFSKFYQDTRKVHNQYNKAYLESEYQFATQSAEMASKWAEYEADGDRYNLQYRTANDDRVRYSHQVLHDTTLPPGDPFWSKYFPPNGWRCRCNVVQVRKNRYPETDHETAMANGSKATYTVGAGGVNASEMFRFNPGKQQVVFPPHHPYFKDQKAVENALRYNEKEERKSEYNALRKDKNYTDVRYNDKGGLMATHKKHTFDRHKGQYEKDVQKVLFDNGHKIILESETGKAIGQKYTDALLDKLKAEIKTIEGDGKNTIKRAMQDAKKQGAESIILYFPDNGKFSMARLADSIAAYNGQTKHRFTEIVFVVDGKVYRY